MANTVVVTESSKLRIEVEYQDSRMLIRPIGKIDEDVNFGLLLKHVSDSKTFAEKVTFDMAKISDINSCGVREWLFFMERLQSSVPCEFLMVNELFIEQANIVPNLLGKAGTKVANFSAPYFCENCNTTIVKTIKVQDVKIQGTSFSFPSFNCEKCKKPLQFDALEEEYANFVKHSSGKTG